ncbi:MAG: VWA domain-containing protein [bacterium]|nr:VWA domain-containing protein [bacterium]
MASPLRWAIPAVMLLMGGLLLAFSFPDGATEPSSATTSTTASTTTTTLEPELLARPIEPAEPVTTWELVCPAGLPLDGQAGHQRELEESDKQLRGVDWSCNDLANATIARVDLRGSDLSGASLRDATLTNVDLTGASLRAADLTDTTLESTILVGTDLRGAVLGGTTVSGSDLTDARFDEGAAFGSSSLAGSYLGALDLREADLSEAVLSNSDFTSARLGGAILEGAEIVRSDLRGADLRQTSLADADLTGSVLTGAALTGADLTGADLTGVTIEAAALGEATLVGATCPDGSPANDHVTADFDANCTGHTTPAAARDEDGEDDAALVPSSAPGVMIVLDASDSMNDPDEAGTVKIEAARSGLVGVVSTFPDSLDVGLRVYGPRGGCSGVEQVPLGPGNRQSVTDEILAVEAGNGTPTAGALRAAAEDFGASAPSRSIILVSDGESNECGGPCEAARELAQQGVNVVQIHALGFEISDEGRAELQCVAEATGGTYRDINGSAELAERIRVIAEAPFDWVALGDSYSSGEGAEDFFFTQPGSLCHRAGAANWPSAAIRQVNAFTDSAWSHVDASCSGAHIDDYYAPQYADGAGGDGNSPQRSALLSLSPTGAKVVTLSIGGNDLGFGRVLERCIVGTAKQEFNDALLEAAGDDSIIGARDVPGLVADVQGRASKGPERDFICRDGDQALDDDGDATEDHQRAGVQKPGSDPNPETQPTRSIESGLSDLEDELVRLLLDLRADYLSHVRNTAAPVMSDLLDERPVRIVVSGYPNPFPDPDQYPSLGSCNFIGRQDLGWLRGQAEDLNTTIKTAVERAQSEAAATPVAGAPFDAEFEFVNQLDVLAGHQLCSGGPGGDPSTAGHVDGPWIHGIDARALVAANGDEFRDELGEDNRGKVEWAIAQYSYGTNDYEHAKARGNIEVAYQFHPNAQGHLAMAQRVRSTILGTEGVPIEGQLGQLASDRPTVDLQVTAGPDALKPGSTIGVDAGPFAPGTEVQVEVRSEPQTVGAITTDPEGYATGTVELPSDLETGEHTVTLTGFTTAGEPVGTTATLTVEAPVEPASARAPVTTEPSDRSFRTATGIPGALLTILGGLLLVAAILSHRGGPNRAAQAGSDSARGGRRGVH